MVDLKCAVCNRSNDEVSLLVQGKDEKCLCNECIKLYGSLLASYSWNTPKETTRKNILKPHEIKALLDKKVVGQDNAKIVLSVAIYNHELFLENKLKYYKKNNVLLIGPTGVGKSLLIETLAETINVPMVICDATTYSEVGYVGNDVSQIIETLYYKSDGNLDKMQNGIVFLDEVDKLGTKDSIQSYGRDVSGVGVQQALLKMIEGKIMPLNVTEKGIDKVITIDTSNILFIFSGVFGGAGIDGDLDEALVNYGMLPEFIGRSNHVVQLNELSKDDLVHIMRDIDNSLCNMYIELFDVDGIELVFTESAIDLLADIAIAKRFGARSLFSIFTNLFNEIRYNSINDNIKKVIITTDVVENVFTRAV